MPVSPQTFEEAVLMSRSLPPQPPTVLLKLYGLYKQATEGDASGNRPGMLDPRGRAKYDAWAANKGMTREAARSTYVSYVIELGEDEDE